MVELGASVRVVLVPVMELKTVNLVRQGKIITQLTVE